MRIRSQIWCAALVAIIAGSTTLAMAARPDGRFIVSNRQKVRAELAAAMADGELSHMEQYGILLRAKDRLSADELQGVQHTLQRLSTQQQQQQTTDGTKPATTLLRRRRQQSAPEQIPLQQPVSVTNRPDADQLANPASYDEPPAPTPDDDGSPFMEEALDPSLDRGLAPGGCGYGMDCDTLGCGPTGCDDLGCEDGCGLGLGGGMMLRGADMFGDGAAWSSGWNNLRFSTTAEAFKGPVDLDNRNGNFGFNFAVNGGFPLIPAFGVGLQVGTSAVLSDFHGTEFTGDKIRAQNFTTVGMFQNCPIGPCNLKYGFCFDWMYDDYFETLQHSQWRVKIGVELAGGDEVGIWSVIPNDGDNAMIGGGATPMTLERFKPVAQGAAYCRHCWTETASTTVWLGMVEEPGEILFGSQHRVAISQRLALIGDFTYIEPSASGTVGQDEEMWHVSMGIEFVPGRFGVGCREPRFAPFFPLANNGTFAIRRY